MTELLRFAMENWGNFLALVVLLILSGAILSTVVDKIKLIHITYVTNVTHEEKINESSERSYGSERE